MSLTLTRETGMMGSKLQAYIARGGRFWLGSMAFDTSYPIGGESLASLVPFTPSQIYIAPTAGYHFEYDRTNNKIKAFTPGKSLIVEEVVAVSSNVGQLKHKPFYILSIEVIAGGTTGPFSVIPTGETPLTVQCAVTFTSGALTFVSTDTVTSCRVTYIPLHETGPFSSDNLVVDETITAATTPVAIANQAAAVQYVWDDNDGLIEGLEPVTEQPTLTHNAVVDIDAGSSNTKIDFHTDDTGNTIKVTYIKYATFAANQQLGDGDLSLSTEVYGFTENHYNHIAIPGLGTALVGEATAVNVALIWSGPSASVGAGVPILNLRLNKWETNEGTAITTLSVPIIFLDALANEGAFLEVANGKDLSSALSSVEMLMLAI